MQMPEWTKPDGSRGSARVHLVLVSLCARRGPIFSRVSEHAAVSPVSMQLSRLSEHAGAGDIVPLFGHRYFPAHRSGDLEGRKIRQIHRGMGTSNRRFRSVERRTVDRISMETRLPLRVPRSTGSYAVAQVILVGLSF